MTHAESEAIVHFHLQLDASLGGLLLQPQLQDLLPLFLIYFFLKHFLFQILVGFFRFLLLSVCCLPLIL